MSNPNTLLVLSFVQVHTTVTLSIIVILASKVVNFLCLEGKQKKNNLFYLQLYYASAEHSNRAQTLMNSGTSRAHPSLAKLRDNLVNGAIDFTEVPITEMNPEDIKVGLEYFVIH